MNILAVETSLDLSALVDGDVGSARGDVGGRGEELGLVFEDCQLTAQLMWVCVQAYR